MYKNKTIIISLIAITITIIFVVVYLLIHIRAEEKDYSTFEATTGLVGLFVAVVSAIYVYNAYSTQKEQIAIQKKEIEDNRKDAEFTRTLDILYRQFEFTNQKHINQVGNENGLIQLHKNLYENFTYSKSLYSNIVPTKIIRIIQQTFTFSEIIRSDLFIYEMIVFSNSLPKENVSIMITMIRTNYMRYLDNFFSMLDAIDVFLSRIDKNNLEAILKNGEIEKTIIDTTLKNISETLSNILLIRDALDEYLTDQDIEDIRRELYE